MRSAAVSQSKHRPVASLPLPLPTLPVVHVLCVGVAAVDFVATVDHYPVPNEKMRSTSLLVEGGGNAANTACAIGRLTPSTIQSSLVAAVGSDSNGASILAGLRDFNVNVDNVQTIPDSSSPFTFIFTTDVDGENTRTCIHQPADGDLSVEAVQSLDLSPFTAVHFDGRYPTAAVSLAQRCCGRGLDDSDDIEPVDGTPRRIPYSVDVERPREGLTSLLAGATIVICNADYCNTVLQSSEPEDACLKGAPAERLRKVLAVQAPNAVIAVQTLGSQGSCLIRLKESNDRSHLYLTINNGILLPADDAVPAVTANDGSLHCDVFPVETVLDTTGAGDAFQGAFLAALWTAAVASQSTGSVSVEECLRQVDPRVLGHAMRIGSRVAAQKIQQLGARRGLPTCETDAVLQSEFRAMMQILSVQQREVT